MHRFCTADYADFRTEVHSGLRSNFGDKRLERVLTYGAAARHATFKKCDGVWSVGSSAHFLCEGQTKVRWQNCSKTHGFYLHMYATQ